MDVVEIDTALDPNARRVVTQCKINSFSLFWVLVRIANVKDQNSRMWPIVVELFESRRAE